VNRHFANDSFSRNAKLFDEFSILIRGLLGDNFLKCEITALGFGGFLPDGPDCSHVFGNAGKRAQRWLFSMIE